MNHIGGDGFWLVREPSGPRARADGARGRPARRPRIALYREHGHDAIPARGPLAALTVPGAIGGWMLALEAAKALGGRLPLDVLLGAAIRHAREATRSTRSQARLTAEKLAELKDVPGFAATFLVDGKPPAAGATLQAERARRDARHLAKAGLDDFYRGDVGREIAADLERIGRPVTRADLEALSRAVSPSRCASRSTPARSTTRRRRRRGSPRSSSSRCSSGCASPRPRASTTCTAWSKRPSAPSACATASSPIRTGCRPIVALSSTRTFLDAEAEKIDRRKAAHWPAPDGEGDTIWMGAADASGLVVSYIQSLYWEFGSGCVLPATGVLMQNRGASFSLDPKALNALAPGRLPFHTLNPALAVLQRRPRHGLRHDGRRRPAADAGRAVHAPRAASASRSTRRSTRRAGCSAAPGARRTPTCAWSRASTAI